ncbi:oxygen-dependent choline dehydrogenase [Aspergillus awamori]|uniref:Oxygen-dependent choline dehydrogenase n=1 Tax=Aspergillus awamori TaxID=105351 RepID=A0A401L9K9_ASPAW|nr:oxygen-dependent choline dehydrogenase [Aspergillus awamori]
MPSADLTSSPEDFLTQTYDYLIIDGGTAGLVVASRLSANPDLRVGVIEAGDAGFDDPNFTNPGKISAMLHNPKYDWMYQSTLSGKVLGGSSAVNFMAYGRPSAVDLDDWGTIAGYSDWSWAGLAPHYRKSEQLESAGLNGPASDLCPVQEEAHGTQGPIHTSLGPWQAPIETPLLAAMNETSGLSRPQEPYSAGYLWPVLSRSNLHVLNNAAATRILLDDKQCACGAEFVFDSNHYQVTVTPEVIPSAGTFESPKLLELSGIGEPEHLASLGVPCRVPLPGVGTNLQEHPVSAVVYELADGVLSIDAILRDESLLKQHLQLLQEQHSGAFSGPVSLMGFIPYWPQVSAERLNETIVSVLQPHSDNATDDADLLVGFPSALAIYRVYADCSKLIPGPPPGRNACYSLMVSSMYPASRGSSHAQSRDPEAAQRVDLGFLTNPADLDVLATVVMVADNIFQSPRMKGQVLARVQPPPEVNLQDVEQAREYVRDRLMSYHHALEHVLWVGSR